MFYVKKLLSVDGNEVNFIFHQPIKFSLYNYDNHSAWTDDRV